MKRREKIEGLLKTEIADILHTDIKDPRIGFVTISRVRVSDDFRNAKVYFSVMGEKEDIKLSEAGLKSAKIFIQSSVGARIRMRFVPILEFFVDDSLEYSAHIDQLLHSINQADDTKNDKQ